MWRRLLHVSGGLEKRALVAHHGAGCRRKMKDELRKRRVQGDAKQGQIALRDAYFY